MMSTANRLVPGKQCTSPKRHLLFTVLYLLGPRMSSVSSCKPYLLISIDQIGGVMASILAPRVQYIMGWHTGRVKPTTIKLVFAAFPH